MTIKEKVSREQLMTFLDKTKFFVETDTQFAVAYITIVERDIKYANSTKHTTHQLAEKNRLFEAAYSYYLRLRTNYAVEFNVQKESLDYDGLKISIDRSKLPFSNATFITIVNDCKRNIKCVFSTISETCTLYFEYDSDIDGTYPSFYIEVVASSKFHTVLQNTLK
jgi:hypothetical protein